MIRVFPVRLLLAAGMVLGAGIAFDPVPAQPLQAGYEVPFAAESPHPYPSGRGKEVVWEVAIDHPGATYIAVHFDRFELGPGDQVVVRSKSDSQHRVFTGRGKGDLGAFWATHIKGETAIVELWSPSPHGGAWGVSIDRYAAGSLDLGTESTAGTEAICGANDLKNAICYQATEPAAYAKARAVARLLINGQWLCTGWLAGCKGDLFTNAHCIGTNNDAINTDYEFMAQAPSCASPNCQLCYPGAIWTGAASLTRANTALDYAFIHLAGDPQSTYGSFLLDNRTPIINERIYLPQHPAGRAKELALQSSDPNDQSGFCEVFNIGVSPCTGGPGDVTYYCDSQGGSSGSPVVAYGNHAVIALHHCGYESPPNPYPCAGANLGVPIYAVVSDLGILLPGCALATPPAPGCATTALLSAPTAVCQGASALLSGAGSTESGLDCTASLRFRFETGLTLVQDWSADPDVVVAPAVTTTYTLRTRDAGAFPGEDTDSGQVTVVPPPSTTVAQTPSPGCAEGGSITLQAGAGFSFYTWRDDTNALVSNGPIANLNQAACGRTYTVTLQDANGCTGTVPYAVACASCAPPEVSSPSSTVPLRLGVDEVESIEFEQLPQAGLAYHLYIAYSKADVLTGNYAHRFCDLELNTPAGTWTPIDARTVRWTPIDPSLMPEDAYYLVIAEDRTLAAEGSYGNLSNGTARPKDADRTGYSWDIYCP